ncbi:hypothetical protein GCM10009549_56410 [Streptomyces thermoalcalitolerans]|uniref:CAAX prenyl protease 2/Lysostaphin resistance protein A-like domain-containing protein n=2 Tax=Streptomyces thermoalcalitolerans TaxID=65605 RepID=A0ABN1PS02_9ACTN
MARYTPHYHGWQLLLGTLLLPFGWLLVTVVLYLLTEVFGRAAGYPELPDGDIDFGPIPGTALDLTYIALLLPLVLLVVLWPGRRPAGTVSSVTGRLRWRWLAWCLLAAVPATVLLAVVSFFLPGDQSGSEETDAWVGWQTFLVSLAMLIALVPLQSAAEEYLFRGWLLQTAGALVRAPWFAVLPQAVLFAAAHGWGTLWGFIDLLVFGLVAGWLSIRTGGLEASIALHAVNNLLAFGVSAVFVGGLETDETAADAPWPLAVTDMATVLLYAVIVLWLARRRSPRNLSSPPPEPAVPHLPYPQPWGTYGPYPHQWGSPGAYPQPQSPYGPYGSYPQSQGAYGPYGAPFSNAAVPGAAGHGFDGQSPDQPDAQPPERSDERPSDQQPSTSQETGTSQDS